MCIQNTRKKGSKKSSLKGDDENEISPLEDEGGDEEDQEPEGDEVSVIYLKRRACIDLGECYRRQTWIIM